MRSNCVFRIGGIRDIDSVFRGGGPGAKKPPAIGRCTAMIPRAPVIPT